MRTNILLSLFLVVAAGCATVPKYDPFVVPKTTIRATVKTVAIYHPQTNCTADVQFERLIENELQKGGFATIGPDRINPIAEKENQAVGGLFNPQTGAEDKAKSEIYWRNVLQAMQTNCHADAVLTFAVVDRRAPFYGDRAEWDGASEGIYMHFGVSDLLLANGTEYGTARGLSLKIVLSNLQREDLYRNYGGIQLASKLPRPARSFARQEFVDVPESQLFSDTNRIFGAVTNALCPLTK